MQISKGFDFILLKYQKIRDQQIQELANILKINTSLRNIQFEYNIVNAQGIDIVFSDIAMRINNSLTMLKIEQRRNVKAIHIKCLADALRINNTLTKLNIEFNDMNEYHVIKKYPTFRRNS